MAMKKLIEDGMPVTPKQAFLEVRGMAQFMQMPVTRFILDSGCKISTVYSWKHRKRSYDIPTFLKLRRYFENARP